MPEITINLDELFGEPQYDSDLDDVRPVSLKDLVVQRAAEMLVKQYGAEAQTAIGHIINQTVTAEIRAVVTAAMAQPIQRTTRWGEPIGDQTTILEIVREKLEEFVTAKSGRRQEFSGQRTEAGNLVELIEDMVRAALKAELSGDIKKARENIAERVRVVLATELPKALAR